MENIEKQVNKAYEENKAIMEIAKRASEAHERLAPVIEKVKGQPKTKKNAVLLYLLSGRPTSMLLALQKFGVGCYRDIIYDLKQEGWDIGYYEGESKSEYGTARFHWHYIKAFPMEYVKRRAEK